MSSKNNLKIKKLIKNCLKLLKKKRSERGSVFLYDVEVIKGGKCGKDRKNAVGGHWTERSEGSGWSEAEFWIACFLRSKKPPK